MGAGAVSIDIMTNELAALQAKPNPTRTDTARRKEIEAELLKHVPRR
jgi:hypothetical protein